MLNPIAVERSPLRFVVLTTVGALPDAMWAAWSWYRFLQARHVELQFAVDGTLEEAEECAIRELFPSVTIFGLQPLLPPLYGRSPALDSFLLQYPLGRKLGLVLSLSQQQSFFYCDHDVLAFDFPFELLKHAEGDLPCYMEEEREGNYDLGIAALCKRMGLDRLPRFNSGLLYIPHNSLSIDLAAQLIENWQLPPASWFKEQTILSVLMQQAKAQPLPRDRYVVSNRRQFYFEEDVDYSAIAARHFTGTVRHVMYGTGMPEILRQARFSNGTDSDNEHATTWTTCDKMRP
ncbi:MAG TPA: hypothetical protein VGR47_16855 [Terracidiphilus sp.]|nr:hypothetical protein [Terracidiphilus sp.]